MALAGNSIPSNLVGALPRPSDGFSVLSVSSFVSKCSVCLFLFSFFVLTLAGAYKC